MFGAPVVALRIFVILGPAGVVMVCAAFAVFIHEFPRNRFQRLLGQAGNPAHLQFDFFAIVEHPIHNATYNRLNWLDRGVGFAG